MTARARVLIADDHAPTRREIAQALEVDGRFAVCAEVEDAARAVAAAVEQRPEICMLDVRMPGNGIAAAWEIAARLPETKVIMLTISDDEHDLLAALRAGASGYLLKDLDPRRLPRALESVLNGEFALPRELVGLLVEEFRDRSSRRRTLVVEDEAPHLTSREWQVLDLLRHELTTTQIAQRLVLSPVTVRTHVGAILRKLRVGSREELLRAFGEH